MILVGLTGGIGAGKSTVSAMLAERGSVIVDADRNARVLQSPWCPVLDAMAENARSYGARSMLLEVRPSNVAAQKMYERYGFVRIGARRGYYPARDGREDAVVMRVPL